MSKSIEELRRICQDPIKERSDYHTLHSLFYRKVSIYFTKAFLTMGITANQTTLLSILLVIIAGIFLVTGDFLFSIVSMLLLQMRLILDNVDGEIARYRNSKHLSGKYLEKIAHQITCPLIFMCMSFGIYKNFHRTEMFILGFLASLCYLWLESPEIWMSKTNDFRKHERQNIQKNFLYKIYDIYQKLKAYCFLFSSSEPSIFAVILIFTVLSHIEIALFAYSIFLPLMFILSVYLRFKGLKSESEPSVSHQVPGPKKLQNKEV